MMRTPVLAVLCVTLLGGCSASAVQSQYFTLRAEPVSGALVSAPGALGIGPVSLPGELQRKQIVTTTDGQQVLVARHAFWADDLDALVARVLAERVGHAFASTEVWAYPWGSRNRPAQSVRVVVTELAGPLGGEVSLKARWHSDAGTGHAILTEPTGGKSYERYSGAVNRLVNRLADTIAADLADAWQNTTSGDDL